MLAQKSIGSFDSKFEQKVGLKKLFVFKFKNQIFMSQSTNASIFRRFHDQ